jgi:hypothetical protein
MMTPENMKLVGDFQRSPDTPKKLEISRQYISDEIGTFDFLSKAREYLEEK